MLKKFMDIFFPVEEDEEDKEIQEELQDEVSETVDENETTVTLEEVLKETAVVEVVQPKEVKPAKSKSTIDIMADGPVVKEVKPMKKARLVRKEEYEIQPVISPYFGMKEENKKVIKTEKKVSPTYHKEVKKNPFNEVISPIYGVKETHDFVIEQNSEPQIFKERKVVEVPSYDVVEEEENMALEDILSNKENGEDAPHWRSFC